MSVPEIFDRQRRRLRRDRAQPQYGRHAFLREAMAEALLDRLSLVNRQFADALDLGCTDGSLTRALRARGLAVTSVDAGARFAAAAGGVQCDEDRLPFAPASFDLIVSAGVLDQVNDLPGALIQCRRLLRPDGLLLAAFGGGGTLGGLRADLLAVDAATGGAVPQRIHPLIDVRAAGDLLGRAGFVLTVADVERVDVRYPHPVRLMHDLRGMAATNLLAGRAPPLDRERIAALIERFATRADADGRVTERFDVIFMTGWAPGPDQPQPARRGSATASLAQALRTKSE